MVLEQKIALVEYLVMEYLLGALLTPSMTLKLLQLVAGHCQYREALPKVPTRARVLEAS